MAWPSADQARIPGLPYGGASLRTVCQAAAVLASFALTVLSHILQWMRAGLAPSGSMQPVSFGWGIVVCGHLQYFGAV